MVQDRFTAVQRRLFTASAGLVVAVLVSGAFVLTYDVLRELAVAGRAGKRWAPVYPVMADALTVMTILSLIVTRHARWWSRGFRWILLLLLLGGVAAISVQHSVWGYESLPDEPLKAGVAVAPHVMLLIAVWLWLTLFKQLRATTANGSKKKAEDEPQAATPASVAAPGLGAPSTASEAKGSDLIPFPDEEREEPETPHAEPTPAEAERVDDEGTEDDEDEDDEDGDPEDTAPLPHVPASLPTDVELVRKRPREEEPSAPSDLSKTTRPDIIRPVSIDAAEDEAESPVVDRAEDPDAGDDDEHAGRGRHRLRRRRNSHEEEPPSLPSPAPTPGDTDGDHDPRIWDWHPPSSTFRSSPTPPAD